MRHGLECLRRDSFSNKLAGLGKKNSTKQSFCSTFTYTVATLTFVHGYVQFQQFVVVELEWSSVTLGCRVRKSCLIGPTCHAPHAISCSLLPPQVSHVQSVHVTQEKKMVYH